MTVRSDLDAALSRLSGLDDAATYDEYTDRDEVIETVMAVLEAYFGPEDAYPGTPNMPAELEVLRTHGTDGTVTGSVG